MSDSSTSTTSTPPAPAVAAGEVHSYLQVATDGTVTGSGQTDPGGAVPSGATVVTKEQLETVAAFRAIGGTVRYINGVVLPGLLPSPTPPTLAQVQASALVQIDSAAETARLQFLSPGSGQSMEYEATNAEAAAAMKLLSATPDAVLDPASFPWLVAEQEALAAVGQAVALADVARSVAATAMAWDVAGAAIKRIRRTAKLQAAAATDPAAVTAIVLGLAWPMPPN